ncbi:MAG: shikimate dehydrogenase [Phototrophicales bacterium]|nr:MAG: shikimate dehydrogenase [Phototrophicales bacterium]
MTKKVGLIGYPVEHSLSPAMHNAAFEALGLDWHYELLPTPPEQLESRIRQLVADGYVGMNVTVPHKQAVMTYLDRIALAARGVGAVNTILIEDSITEGHNTDVAGFILDLESAGFFPQKKHALVLGAGGSARAVVLGLANRGAQVTVSARREEAAWQLREDVRKGVSYTFDIRVQAWASLQSALDEADLIVNCTPVGMWPNVDESPLSGDLKIRSESTVYDLVYRPAKTRLLQQAEAAGARAIGGLGMLVYQGAAAFELWTGQTAPIEVMRQAALSALEKTLR